MQEGRNTACLPPDPAAAMYKDGRGLAYTRYPIDVLQHADGVIAVYVAVLGRNTVARPCVVPEVLHSPRLRVTALTSISHLRRE